MLLTERVQRCVARCLHELSRAGRGLQRMGVVALLLLGLVVGVQPGLLHAQETTSKKQMYRVETTDGQVVIGALISKTEQEVVLDSQELGEITIQRENIESLEEILPDRFRDGEYWFPNPQSTRYFFAPNAIGIPQGEGYYQNAWILFNNVNYGASESFSIGAGTVPIFLFGVHALPIWVLPKLSVSTPQDNLHLAGGAVFGGVLGEGGGEGVGLVYGGTTIGARDHNATVNIGYGYAGEEFANHPVINVSGMTRVGRTFYLISENYFYPGEEDANLISVGIRWAPENFAVDFALVRPLNAEDFVGFPWLGVTIPFGR